MTSKEFLRRVNYYSNWLSAFDIFSSELYRDHAWKISIFDITGSLHVEYSLSPYVVPRMIFDYDVDSIFVERYSVLLYQSDLRFFKSFVSALSSYQLDVLKSDSRFTNILNFISNEKK